MVLFKDTDEKLLSSISDDLVNYNFLIGCKFYYESDEKPLLPNRFQDMWNQWRSRQKPVLSRLYSGKFA